MFQKTQDKCQICQDYVTDNLYQVNCCKHKYHIECIKQWFAISDKCPNCRSTIEKELLKINEVNIVLKQIRNLKFDTPEWIECKIKINELNDEIMNIRVGRIIEEYNLNGSNSIEKIVELERQYVRNLIGNSTNNEEKQKPNDKWYDKILKIFK